MAGRTLSETDIAATIAAMQKHQHEDGKPIVSAIARELGISRSTTDYRIEQITSGRYAGKLHEVRFPAFVEDGDEQEPIEQIRSRMAQNFERKRKATEARNWFPIRIQETKPYGLLWFGDPHLDDDGCNWPMLERHIEVARQEGIYGANIGDTTNNWVGRLMAKYADQETSLSTADRLAKWFMLESGVTWLIWLLGNHDLWNNGASFYKRLGAKQIPVIDWRAKFKICHPGGTEIRIDASHGRKGSSIYNELHGTLREAVMGETADLYVTGHTHNFAMEQLEVARRNHLCWLMQLRGYKHFDDYALVKGFPEHHNGAAILAIVDPAQGRRSPVVTCYEDVEAGADYLKWLRARS